MKRLLAYIMISALCLEAAALDPHSMGWMRGSRSTVDMALAGSASLSSDNMAWMAFGNTASLPFADKKFAADLSFSMPGNVRTMTTAAGFSMNINPKWGVSAGVSYGFGPSIPMGDGPKSNGEHRFVPGQLQVNAGFGSKFHEMVSGGVVLYYARQTLYPSNELWTAGLNGYLNVHWSDYTFGAGIINFGLPARDAAGNTTGTPTSVQLNFMYDKDLPASWRIQLNAGIDGFVPECGIGLAKPQYMGEFFGKVLAQGIQYRFTGQIGAQASYNDWLFLRAGYHYAPDILPAVRTENIPVYIPAHASVGVGLKLHHFNLGAAYIFGSRTITNTFSVSLGYTF